MSYIHSDLRNWLTTEPQHKLKHNFCWINVHLRKWVLKAWTEEVLLFISLPDFLISRLCNISWKCQKTKPGKFNKYNHLESPSISQGLIEGTDCLRTIEPRPTAWGSSVGVPLTTLSPIPFLGFCWSAVPAKSGAINLPRSTKGRQSVCCREDFGGGLTNWDYLAGI